MMGFLDVILNVAIGITVLGVFVAKVAIPYLEKNPLYTGDKEEAARDKINRDPKVIARSIFIGALGFGVWLLACRLIVDQLGMGFLAVILCAFFAMPIGVATLAILAAYTLTVHATAGKKQ